MISVDWNGLKYLADHRQSQYLYLHDSVFLSSPIFFNILKKTLWNFLLAILTRWENYSKARTDSETLNYIINNEYRWLPCIWSQPRSADELSKNWIAMIIRQRLSSNWVCAQDHLDCDASVGQCNCTPLTGTISNGQSNTSKTNTQDLGVRFDHLNSKCKWFINNHWATVKESK